MSARDPLVGGRFVRCPVCSERYGRTVNGGVPSHYREATRWEGAEERSDAVAFGYGWLVPCEGGPLVASVRQDA